MLRFLHPCIESDGSSGVNSQRFGGIVVLPWKKKKNKKTKIRKTKKK